MNEQYVRVPESLIEQARDAIRSAGPAKWTVYEEVVALLSQPTPTAGPSPLWCEDDAPHEAHRERNELGGWNECTGRPADPPTRTAEPFSYSDVWNAAIDRAQEELVRQDQFSERTLRILDEQRIPDPSTIRDVTPPA